MRHSIHAGTSHRRHRQGVGQRRRRRAQGARSQGERRYHAGRRGHRLDALETTRELSEVDFIFQVGPLSFVVALLAGAAGMLSLVSAKSAALVGVFISVRTVPAAGFAVVAATVGDWAVAAQSAAQLAVNLVGIVLAGVLVLWVRQLADRGQ
jgi:Domain of unknown function (DUF389)